MKWNQFLTHKDMEVDNMSGLPSRDSIEDKYKWKLEDVYSDESSGKKTLNQLKRNFQK